MGVAEMAGTIKASLGLALHDRPRLTRLAGKIASGFQERPASGGFGA